MLPMLGPRAADVRKSTQLGVHLRVPGWQTGGRQMTRGPGWATRINQTTTHRGTMMSEQSVYGATKAPVKVRTHHLQKWKSEGHKWSMLTAYDFSTARIFDDAGIPVLLVGDSAANVVYGYDTTLQVTVDELI